MKKLLLSALALLMALPVPPVAAINREQRSIVIVAGYDLDGAAASATAVVATATAADSTTFTIAAQPDACRPLLLTVTDGNASITAGTLTVAGTDGDGNYKTTVFTFAAGGSLTSALGTFCTVISVITGVLTGEGGGADTLSVGTTGAAGYQYPIAWGPVSQPGFGTGVIVAGQNNNLQQFQPNAAFNWFAASGGGETTAQLVKTATANATALTSFTASSGAFTVLNVGDLILLNDDADIPRVLGVLAKTDNDNITVDREITVMRAAGRGYKYRRLHQGAGHYSGWFSIENQQYFTIGVDVVQLNGTGGINVQVECATEDILTPFIVSTLSPNFTAVGTQLFVFSAPHGDVCRVGLQWATNDDATDTLAGSSSEKINVYVTFQQ